MTNHLPDDDRFFCTVRLEGDSTRATGFLVEVADTAGTGVIFLATARHAFESTESLTLRLLAADEDGAPDLGRQHRIAIDNIDSRWTAHPDDGIDLAVLALDDILAEVHAPTYLRPISTDRFHSASSLASLPSITTVTFFGYPSGISDPKHTTPLARRGYSATPPVLDYAGGPQFLIDASVFPGSSGSPVFSESAEPDFLGVVVQAKAGPAPSAPGADEEGQLEMLDLGVVYKAPALLDLLRDAD